MKKYILLFLTLFFLNISSVFAVDRSVGELRCNYKKGLDTIEVTYYNVGAVDVDVKYRVIYKKNNGPKYCYSEGSIDRCLSEKGITPWLSGIHNFYSDFSYDNKTFYSLKNRFQRTSYQSSNNLDKNMCPKAVMLYDEEGIIVCETSSTDNVCDYNKDVFTPNGKGLAVSNKDGLNNLDYNSSYNEAREEQDKYCNETLQNGEENPDYDAEKCQEAKNDVRTIGTQAQDNGVDVSALEMDYIGLKNVNVNFDFTGGNSCDSYLGNPAYDANAKQQSPAYYLQFSFNLMKYIAIILLFVLTVIEFAKATASSNQDAMKKAIQTSIKRLIICVIIFFLPMLIEFILKLFGIYSNCNIS